MNDLLDRLTKAVAELAAEPTATTETAETVEMSPVDFVKHVQSEIEKAVSEEGEIRSARIANILQNISVAKEFIGSPQTPGGLLAVSMFRDPAQVKETSKEMAPTGALPNATAISTNPVPPAVNGAGSVNGDKMPPLNAGGSGFATAFSKAVESISGIVKELEAADAPEVKTDGVAKADATETKTETVEATEKARTVWPLDMSTPFGLGETEDPETPEWGLDGNASAE